MKTRAILTALLIGAVFMISPGAFASDTDGDGWEDDADNCVSTGNADQANNDLDDLGDVCDSDDDNDDVHDSIDLYPLDSSRSS